MSDLKNSVVKSATLAGLLLAAANGPGRAAPAAPPPTVGDYRGNPGHTGVSPETLSAPLSLLWRHTAAATKGNPASPVFGGGLVYFTSGGVAYALDPSDGTTRWQFPADGKPKNNFGATPLLSGGALYLCDDGGQVTKLDAASGKTFWTTTLEGAIRSAPTLSGGLLYLGSGANHCYALNADTGRIAWDQQPGGAVSTPAIVLGGLVAFASTDGNVYGLSARDGHQVWVSAFDPDPGTQPLAYDGASLYVTSGDTLTPLNPSNGARRPSVKLPTLLAAPPTASAGGLYAVTQSNVLYALAPGGAVRWRATLDSAATAPPLLAGGLLLTTTQGGVVSGYDAATGRLVWRYTVQSSATDSQPKPASVQVSAAPTLAGGALYVVSDDGTLSAFRPDAPDNIGPQLPLLVPAADAVVPSLGLTYGASLVDDGSGINPATVSLSVDGVPDTGATYRAGLNALYNTPATALKEGQHRITVKAADWRGNTVSRTWSFTVQDNTNNGRGGRGGFGRGGGFNPNAPDYPGRGGNDPNAPPPPPPITPF